MPSLRWPFRREGNPFFWTATTHLDGIRLSSMAVYIAFGRAMGAMNGQAMDAQDAGVQRSDPKTGQVILGRGPQGDAPRVENFVRCVRDGGVVSGEGSAAAESSDPEHFPGKVTNF